MPQERHFKVYLFLLFYLSNIIFFACATPLARKPHVVEPPKGPLQGVEHTPDITNPFKPFLEEHLKKAFILEKQVEISTAIEEFKIALTIDPENKEAKEGLRRLFRIADREAKRHLKKGISLKKGNPSKAYKEFLTALRIKPELKLALYELKGLHLLYAKSKLLTHPVESVTGIGQRNIIIKIESDHKKSSK
jgi:tetratricopeptide (TPR) repeat protein